MKQISGMVAFLGLLMAAGSAWAQAPEPPPVLQGRPDAEQGAASPLLGHVFESQSAGIAFRAPANCTEVRRSVSGDELVHYVNDQKKWLLRVSRYQFGQPLPLTNHKDPQGKSQQGLLGLTVDQLKLDKPGAEILREDIVPLGETTVGMIAARYSIGVDTLLHQQALVRASDRNYFVFTFTSPAPRSGDVSQDAAVRNAVETFNAVLDSVRLLDQTSIKQDQDQRLYRTRSLFLNLNENRLRNELVAEQWLRLIRDGKDIGYTYIVEEVAADLPRKQSRTRKPGEAQGVLVGMRSRTRPEAGVQVDAESWMWMSFDRKHEKWSNIATIAAGDKRETVSEFGASDWEVTRSLAKDPRGGVARPGEVRSDGSVDQNQPAVRSEETYVLTVTHFSQRATAQPIRRELPVFYLPQALGHLLPRTVPRFEQKGYMFATYVSDNREVMARYIDVGREVEVTLAGQLVRAIPVRDRVGLEGSATVHYISPEGKYLGSVNADSKITILPTDAANLEKIWQDADLTRPGAVEEKK